MSRGTNTGPSAPAISGGRLRGLRLDVPRGHGTRPTRAMVRQAMFAMLGERVPGARVLDLYAGSGALGLEAISRGAASAVFVERDGRAIAALRSNIERCKLDRDSATIVRRDVLRWRPDGEACFDLVLADPPYDLLEPLPAVLAEAGVLAPDGCLLVEGPPDRIAPPGGLDLSTLRRRVHGGSAFGIYVLRAGN